MFENPRRGRQARNFTTNVPKILDLKSSSEQIFSKNCRWVPLKIGECIHLVSPSYETYQLVEIYINVSHVTAGIFPSVLIRIVSKMCL